MRAKYTCESVTDHGSQEEVKLRAVYADGNPENNQFNTATPWGNLVMGIDNPEARGFFKPGNNYYLDISQADEATATVNVGSNDHDNATPSAD